jgi:hypothetical protein
MKRTSISIAKIRGKAKVARDPRSTASPRRMASIPRYIGWRLIRKGPETKSAEGVYWGLTVVLLFLKSESAQRFKTTPKAINKRPR